jgi:hypothetical protein
MITGNESPAYHIQLHMAVVYPVYPAGIIEHRLHQPIKAAIPATLSTGHILLCVAGQLQRT